MLLKRALAILGFLLCGAAHAFAPQNGLWIFDLEENGKPGRGLTLEVQNEILVLTLYAYEADGRPTFYIGTGKLDFVSSNFGPDVKVATTFDLMQYSGGRFLGSGAKEATSLGSAGKVELVFDHGTAGKIKLPGEAEKRISKFLYGYSRQRDPLTNMLKQGVDEMLGGWFFTTGNGDGSFETKFVFFNNVIEVPGNGGVTERKVVSQDGLMVCGIGSRFVSMQEFPPQYWLQACSEKDKNGNLIRIYDLEMGINEGQGYSDLPVVTLSNRKLVFLNRVNHQNGRGLGVLPGFLRPLQ
jgi:hypothetical protein